MLQLVEQRSDAGDVACVEFHVYAKPKNREVVFGEMLFFEPAGRGKAVVTTSNLGVPVGQAFAGTVNYANERRIPFIWIDDPHNLLPPSKRPAQ
jgi:hypothetical protein